MTNKDHIPKDYEGKGYVRVRKDKIGPIPGSGVRVGGLFGKKAGSRDEDDENWPA